MSKEMPLNDFGAFISYLVPGATVLVGFSQFAGGLRSLFVVATDSAPTIGGFLYLTVASLAAGMTVSAVRWAVVDTFHGWTGLRMPALDFSKLGRNVEAFGLLIEIHYRHYLFYSNELIACALAYVCYRIKLGAVPVFGWPDLAFIVLEPIFFATSRDTLRKYFERSGQLLAAKKRQSVKRADKISSRRRVRVPSV